MAEAVRSTTSAFRRDPLAALARARDAGDATWLVLGRRRLLVLSHPDAIEEALVRQARSLTKEKVLWGGWTEQLVQREGPGTIGSEDRAVHTRSRRRVQPAFATSRLDGMRPAVRDAALALVEAWPADGLELWPALRRYAIGAFGAAMLETTFDEVETRALDERLGDVLASYQPVTSASLLALNLARRRRLGRAAAAGDETQRRLGELLAAARPGDDGLLGLLRGSELEPRLAAQDAFTILLAAVDTSASLLGWLCCLLAADPALCERLAAEWAAAGDGLGELPLAARVTQETLRLYPSSWFVARSVAEPATVAGLELEPGTTVVTSPYVVHRDPRWYDEPDRFDPARWESPPPRPKFAFFPFGGGVRQCPGEPLARIEGELLAGAIASRLSLSPLTALPRPLAGASLRFRGPVRLAARPR